MLESASRNYLAHDEVVRGVYVADIQAMLHRRRYIYIYHVYRGAGHWKSLLLSANEARSGSYRHSRFC